MLSCFFIIFSKNCSRRWLMFFTSRSAGDENSAAGSTRYMPSQGRGGRCMVKSGVCEAPKYWAVRSVPWLAVALQLEALAFRCVLVAAAMRSNPAPAKDKRTARPMQHVMHGGDDLHSKGQDLQFQQAVYEIHKVCVTTRRWHRNHHSTFITPHQAQDG